MNRFTKYKGLAWLMLLIVVVPLMTYRYAVNGTVKQWCATGKYRQEVEQLRRTATGQGKIQALETDGTEMIVSGLLVAELLPFIDSEGLRIEHFSPCVTSDNDGILLTTGQLSLQGGFAGIVRLLERIERDIPQCKIIAAQYRTTKPRNHSGTKTLGCTMYVQQIITDNN